MDEYFTRLLKELMAERNQVELFDDLKLMSDNKKKTMMSIIIEILRKGVEK